MSNTMPPTTAAGRRILGDRSTNVPPPSPSNNAQNMLKSKPTAGSPLKRSFTAMMEDERGLTYLKARRLSADKPLSQAATQQPEGSMRSVFDSGVEMGVGTGGAGFRPLAGLPLVETSARPVPAIQELSPTEPNTPSSSGDDTQDSSAERKSFSSLINYDPSSQQIAGLIIRGTSRAEMLKLRLRVAMYKVRTNQVDIPFSQLETQQEDEDSKLHSTAVEAAVAALRHEAMLDLARQQRQQPRVPNLGLLPAPVLLPTAYSSRMIYEPLPPSSSPASVSPEKQTLPGVVPHCLRQLSSPPRSPERRYVMRDEAELTSSVVKGRVAEGLLGLRNAI